MQLDILVILAWNAIYFCLIFQPEDDQEEFDHFADEEEFEVLYCTVLYHMPHNYLYHPPYRILQYSIYPVPTTEMVSSWWCSPVFYFYFCHRGITRKKVAKASKGHSLTSNLRRYIILLFMTFAWESLCSHNDHSSLLSKFCSLPYALCLYLVGSSTLQGQLGRILCRDVDTGGVGSLCSQFLCWQK